jgi:hypothetical protein
MMMSVALVRALIDIGMDELVWFGQPFAKSLVAAAAFLPSF